MAIKKTAKRNRVSKKRYAKTGDDLSITPAQKKKVLADLDTLQKEAEDVAIGIAGVRNTLCKVDFCSG